MSQSRWIRSLVVGLSLASAAFGSQAALAHGGGGGFRGGVVAHGGFSRGSSFGGYRGGYVGRGYTGGYYRGYAPARNYYYGGGYSPFWGVLGLGLFVASLPLYHSTYYWNGSPYYYADGYYYRYDDSVRQYERVTLPSEATTSTSRQSPVSTELFVYPKNGQSDEQVARDRAECLEWADRQDAPAAGSGAAPAPMSAAESMRAQSACLEGRGYTVR